MDVATFVQFGTDQSYVEWSANIENAGDYLVSFRYALLAQSTPLSIFINGVEVKRQPKNPTIDIVNYSRSPSLEDLPLQRCEGDCDNGECADGLFCVNRLKTDAANEIPVPGCRMDNAQIGWDYCADVFDYTHGALLLPTGSWVDNWLYSEPINIALFAGENKILAQVPTGHDSGPNIDHMKIEAEALPTYTPAPSFRNPPHFMSE